MIARDYTAMDAPRSDVLPIWQRLTCKDSPDAQLLNGLLKSLTMEGAVL